MEYNLKPEQLAVFKKYKEPVDNSAINLSPERIEELILLKRGKSSLEIYKIQRDRLYGNLTQMNN
jgi:hypothetical protein